MSEHNCAGCRWHEPDKETGTGRSYCIAEGGPHCGEWTTDEWTCGAWEPTRAPKTGSLRERLLAGDWHGMTVAEIAAYLGTSAGSVSTTLGQLRKAGHEIDYVRRGKGGKPLPEDGDEDEPDGARAAEGRPYREPEPAALTPRQAAALAAKETVCCWHSCEDCPLYPVVGNDNCREYCLGHPDEAITLLRQSMADEAEAARTSTDGAETVTAECEGLRAAEGRPYREAVGRAECLARALDCVCGAREEDYGTPEDSFDRIAKLWSAYRGEPYTAQDVAAMMALLKLARIGSGRATVDSWVDLAGYAACGCEITTTREADS